MKILKYIIIALVTISAMATSVSCQKTSGEMVIMTVASRTGTTSPDLPEDMQREILWVKIGESQEWRAMGLSWINDFQYVPGYEYVIWVMIVPVENPPADGDSFHYQYLSTISKTIKESEGLPDAV